MQNESKAVQARRVDHFLVLLVFLLTLLLILSVLRLFLVTFLLRSTATSSRDF